MVDETKDEADIALPIYTEVRQKRGSEGLVGNEGTRNLKGKGWSLEGRLRFSRLDIEIGKFRRDNPEVVERLGLMCLRRYKELYGRCDGNEEFRIVNEDVDAIMEREKEEEEWKKHMEAKAKRRKLNA